MNTQKHTDTKKSHPETKSSKTPTKDLKSKDAKTEDNLKLQPHAEYTGEKLGFGTKEFLPSEAKVVPNTTNSSQGPIYMRDTWRDFVQGRVTDEHINLVRVHAKSVGIDNAVYDHLVARDPQNIQLLAQLV